MKRVYLASNSPRRQEILNMMGIQFDVVSAEIDESIDSIAPPRELVARLAEQKAQSAIQQHGVSPAGYVIAGDTLIFCENKVMGKPKDQEDAREILQTLSNQTHAVYSAVALAHNDTIHVAVNKTEVSFCALEPEDVERYLLTDEAYDKAGAYAIQGYAARWITEIKGSYHAVMGLPVYELEQLLKQTEFYNLNY
ncbi:Maf family protein [Thiomicrorhabdus indica]|uniref:Maf family protein n=1 Tax=Thiomicrorhabdus indica TaxID=2267253 RepID=UPI0013EE43EF|nr:Maf family protein [Thiomicrorhabdus indica]